MRTEIQEQRHGRAEAMNLAQDTLTTDRSSLDRLVHNLDVDLEVFSRTIQSITEQFEALKGSIAYGGSREPSDHNLLQAELDDLQSDWADLVEADVRLRDELKEDSWLVLLRQ